jgi:hypothetical protein
MSPTSTERVADAQEMVWKLEAKYGPVLAEVIDQVAVAHRLAEIEVPTVKAVREAFDSAGMKRPPAAYSAELATMLARRVKRRGLEDLIVDFRQYAIGALSRRFGGKTKGRELELRDYLRTYLVPRGYTEAEAGRGDNDLVVPSIPAIIETKIWESEDAYKEALRQLDRYLHTEKPKEAYLVMFGDREPLPSIIGDPTQAIVEPRPVLSGLKVPVVVVPFEVDYPSKLKEADRKRARNGRS